MWILRFNHLTAIAAAKKKGAELGGRKRLLALAELTAVTSCGEITTMQQQLANRQRALERCIEDPYPADSLFHIGYERDRRAIREAGVSQLAPLPA